MAMSIHKPGQGYWVRAMTAGLIGLATVALAVWLYGQSQLVAELLPKQVWNSALAPGQTAAQAEALIPKGSAVVLRGSPDKNGQPTVIGSGMFSGITVGTTGLPSARLENVRLERNAKGTRHDGSEIKGIVQASALVPGAVEAGGVLAIDKSVGEPPIAGNLLGGIVVAVVLVVGALLGFWIVGTKVSTVEWLIACDYEMKRVNWSTRKTIIGSTWVVIGACVLLALMLFITDYGLQTIFRAMRLL